MLAASAALLNINVLILDNGENAPAKQVIVPPPGKSHIDGSFSDPEKIRALAEKVDVLTVEIEHVNADVLEEIENAAGKTQVHPSSKTIRIIQDKLLQKSHLKENNIPVAGFVEVASSAEAIASAAKSLGLPLMLKSRTLAYDGRGNYALRDLKQTASALSALSDRPLYAEKWAAFEKEIAVMVVRDVKGEVQSYPAVETVHKENVCHLVFAPLRTGNPRISQRAKEIAEAAVKTFTGAGVFGVEMFLMSDGTHPLVCETILR